jgi:hypothetical protein
VSAPQAGDKSAGFTGLILGSIAIFVIVFAIVRITNAKYSGEHAEAPAAASTPAASTPAASTPAATTPAATPTPSTH